MASVHPLGAKELRALRQLQRETAQGVHVFVSERLAPLSVAGYQRMVARAGEAAKFGFLVHSVVDSSGEVLGSDRPSPVISRSQRRLSLAAFPIVTAVSDS
jgi:hypothetical protein